MKFEQGKIYDFSFKAVKYYGGKPYLLLTYGEDKAETLPGYEENHWIFRVRAYDFQLKDENSIADKIPCYVSGYIKDTDNVETTFPFLQQDLETILKRFYKPGEKYLFTVSAKPGQSYHPDGTPVTSYMVSDAYGLEHDYNPISSFEIGETVELTVESIEGHRLKFANEIKQQLKKLFEVGKEYTFLIDSEELDANGKKYYGLIDRLKGFIHRFYFTKERKDGPGEEIRLQVKAFLKNGWLLLADPAQELSQAEIASLKELEEGGFGRENDVREYKSSLLYTGAGEKNLDKQLGREIMQQLASFMNAEGGCVYIGYTDDGTICGIEKELSELNTSEEDEYAYKPTLDGLELKIRNTIGRHLGGLANTVTKIHFRKSTEGHMVCHVEVPASPKPIFLNGHYLYRRSGNMCQLLKGDEVTFFILSRMKSPLSGGAGTVPAAATQSSAATKEVTKQEKEAEYRAPVPSVVPAGKSWTHFTFYKDGSVSRQTHEKSSPEVLFDIPLSTAAKNKSGRLLLCYDNGCVNVVNPGEVYAEKLTESKKAYKNGWNTKAKLLHVYECRDDDYLVIRSRNPDGKELIKAVCVGNYAVHSPKSMQTQGNCIVDSRRVAIVDMELVPGVQQSFIYPIILKSKNSFPGYSAQDYKFHDVMAFLKRRKAEQAADEARS